MVPSGDAAHKTSIRRGVDVRCLVLTMAHPLEGRVAVVTGAAAGIGFAVARRLLADGASLVLNDLTGQACDHAVAKLAPAGGPVASVPGDVSDPATSRSIVDAAVGAFGGLDIVVNNAGIARDAPIGRMSDDDWNAVHRVTLFGSFSLLRASAEVMRTPRPPERSYHRKVVNMSSSVGLHGAPGTVNYATAKAGLIGLTRSLAREWARYLINVNAVAPGFIAGTKMASSKSPGLLAQVTRNVPLGRAGRPEDVAGAVAFLASADSDYITGQVIEIHGGLDVLG
jgi:3-oxoacyl-[acyl-carrier protein] reductase